MAVYSTSFFIWSVAKKAGYSALCVVDLKTTISYNPTTVSMFKSAYSVKGPGIKSPVEDIKIMFVFRKFRL